MGDRRDYVALDWVKAEISETLKLAQQALEAYSELAHDAAQLRLCLDYVHQVHGTLQMVEFHGAALLAEEIESLGTSILDNGASSKLQDDAHAVMVEAMVQLPAYLDSVASSRQQDLPILLLPILNDLRSARGERTLTISAFFNPSLSYLSSPRVESQTALPRDEKFYNAGKKLRQVYQVSLVGVIRQDNIKDNLERMRKVSFKLHQLFRGGAFSEFWYVSAAFVEGLMTGDIALGPTSKLLLREVDKELRLLITDTEQGKLRDVPEDLLKNLLYYLAKSNSQSEMVSSVKENFDLASLLPSDADIEVNEQQRLLRSGRDAVNNVGIALREEVEQLKSKLDSVVRRDSLKPSLLKQLIPGLKKVADTMAVLGYMSPRSVVQGQIDAIERLDDGQKVSSSRLMDIASSLLQVEASLASLELASQRHMPSGESLGSSSQVVELQLNDAQKAVIREVCAGLDITKESIQEFIKLGWNQEYITDVPETLASVRGGLSMIPLDQAATILGVCEEYIGHILMAPGYKPDWYQLEVLADSISRVEYYLERLSAQDEDAGSLVLEAADKQLNVLLSAIETHKSAPESAKTAALIPSSSQQNADAEPEFDPMMSADYPEDPLRQLVEDMESSIDDDLLSMLSDGDTSLLDLSAPQQKLIDSNENKDFDDADLLSGDSFASTEFSVIDDSEMSSTALDDVEISDTHDDSERSTTELIESEKTLGDDALLPFEEDEELIDLFSDLTAAGSEGLDEGANNSPEEISYRPSELDLVVAEDDIALSENSFDGENPLFDEMSARTNANSFALDIPTSVSDQAFENDVDDAFGENYAADSYVIDDRDSEAETIDHATGESLLEETSNESVQSDDSPKSVEIGDNGKALPRLHIHSLEAQAFLSDETPREVESTHESSMGADELEFTTGEDLDDLSEISVTAFGDSDDDALGHSLDIEDALDSSVESIATELASDSDKFSEPKHANTLAKEPQTFVDEPLGMLDMPADISKPKQVTPVQAVEIKPESKPPQDVVQADFTSSSADDSDLIDDEVIEIFLEEAEEVIEAINEYWPKYAADNFDQDALTTVRRSFHTLKGSGRMVKAYTVGELSWSVEDLLNRVLDMSVDTDEVLIEFVDLVRAQLPMFVGDFKDGVSDKHQVDADALSEAARALMQGQTVNVSEILSPVAEVEAGSATDTSSVVKALPSTDIYDENGFDPTLLRVFKSEAEAHQAVIKDFVNLARRSVVPQLFSEQLQRALHTLQGSANMAGLDAIAEVAAPMESYVKELRGYHLETDGESLELLEQVSGLIQYGISQLDNLPLKRLPGTDEFLFDLEDARVSRLEAVSDLGSRNSQESAGYQQLLQIFLSEGMDTLIHADESLSVWHDNIHDNSPVVTLQKELNTLSDAADQADQVAIAQLSEALAASYEPFVERTGQPSEIFVDTVLRGHEVLINMMDQLAAGEVVLPADELVEALLELKSHARSNAEETKQTVEIDGASLEAPFATTDVDASADVDDFTPSNLLDTLESAAEESANNDSTDTEEAQSTDSDDFQLIDIDKLINDGDSEADKPWGEPWGDIVEKTAERESVEGAADEFSNLDLSSSAQESIIEESPQGLMNLDSRQDDDDDNAKALAGALDALGEVEETELSFTDDESSLDDNENAEDDLVLLPEFDLAGDTEAVAAQASELIDTCLQKLDDWEQESPNDPTRVSKFQNDLSTLLHGFNDVSAQEQSLLCRELELFYLVVEAQQFDPDDEFFKISRASFQALRDQLDFSQTLEDGVNHANIQALQQWIDLAPVVRLQKLDAANAVDTASDEIPTDSNQNTESEAEAIENEAIDNLAALDKEFSALDDAEASADKRDDDTATADASTVDEETASSSTDSLDDDSKSDISTVIKGGAIALVGGTAFTGVQPLLPVAINQPGNQESTGASAKDETVEVLLPPPDESSLIERVDQDSDLRLGLLSEDDDERMLIDIFLEESIDLLDAISHALDVWQDDPDDLGPVIELQRDLHTLKGGANMAELNPISDLCHELESVYQFLQNRTHESYSDVPFGLLHQAHDSLSRMLDQVSDGDYPTAATALVDQLLAYQQSINGGEKSAFAVENLSRPFEKKLDPLASKELENIALEEAVDDSPNIADSLNLDSTQEENTDIGADEAEADSQLDESSEPVANESVLLNEGVSFKALSLLDSDSADRAIEGVDDKSESTELHGVDESQLSQGESSDTADGIEGDNLPKQSNISREVSELADSEDYDEFDVEVLEIFVDEAQELIAALDQTIHEWEANPESLEHSEQLQRILHTLKGGARLSGFSEVGDLSHDFEAFLATELSADEPLVNKDFFVAVHKRYDILAQHIEQVQRQLDKLNGHITPASSSVHELPKSATPTSKEAPKPESQEPVNNNSASEDDKSSKVSNIVPFIRNPRKISDSPDTANLPPAGPSGEDRPEPIKRAPAEMVKVSSTLLDGLVNLAGETSISRSLLEQQVTDLGYTLEEMESTIERLREQLRRLDMETEAQVLFRQERADAPDYSEFDPLEMDRYSHIQQLSRALVESASDLLDLKQTLSDKARDAETLLLQQSRVNTELQEGLMQTRMVPFSRLVPRLRRIVRQISNELKKDVELHTFNADGQLDRTVLERMISPLEHMLRNAIDHGIESREQRESVEKNPVGQIELRLSREGGDVVIRLSDDGKGVDVAAVRSRAIERGLVEEGEELSDQEIMQFILQAGFTTTSEITQISGRGVGMDVVNSEVKQLGGTMLIDSVVGQGVTFTIRLPIAVAVTRALMIRSDEDLYAVPLSSIDGIVRISVRELLEIKQSSNNLYKYAGQEYEMNHINELLGHSIAPMSGDGQGRTVPVVLVRSAECAAALQVDALLGSREIVVKTLGPQFGNVIGVSGGTILGDGSVVIILDLPAMVRTGLNRRSQHTLRHDDVSDENRLTRVMVVDDSVTVRKVTSRLLERNGYETVVAKDGVDAMAILQDYTPDILLLDIEMPRMDGFELASQIRHDSRLRNVPIVMITSRTGEKHRDRAHALGVQSYMGKPFQESELMSTIEELVGPQPS